MKQLEGGNFVASDLIRISDIRPVRAIAPRRDLLEEIVERNRQHGASERSKPLVKFGKGRQSLRATHFPPSQSVENELLGCTEFVEAAAAAYGYLDHGPPFECFVDSSKNDSPL